MSEPSDWLLARLVMERDRYVEAARVSSEARVSYLEALLAAHDAGFSFRALAGATGVDHTQLFRDHKKAVGSGATPTRGSSLRAV